MKNNNYPIWLVPLDIAKELKEIGFDEPSHFYFLYYLGWEMLKKRGDEYGFITSNRAYVVEKHNENGNLSIPTWEQVFEWFREKGMFHSICIVDDLLEGVKCFEAEIRDNNGDIICILSRVTYEEAREALVKALIQTYKREQL